MSETTKRIDFEDWLMEYHCENNPEILDDMLPDCFADWVSDLDYDDWIRLGNIYAKKIATHLHMTNKTDKEQLTEIITTFECELPDACNFTAGFALGESNIQDLADTILKEFVLTKRGDE